MLKSAALPKVVVVVLNFRKPHDTLECLESMFLSDYPFFEVLVVDNNSGDNSVAVISKKYPRIAILENPVNLGYAEGNNVGIRRVLEQGAEYVFVINNDTALKPDTLSKLVSAAESDPLAAITAPKVMCYDMPKVLNSCGTDMDWFRLRPKIGHCGQEDRGQYGKITGKIFPGCALLFRRDFLLKEGLFDAGFFLIHEDADICYRALERGYHNLFVPEAVFYHKVSLTLSSYPKATQYYTTRNFLYLAERHAGALQKLLTAAGVFFYSAVYIARLVFGGKYKRLEATGFFCGVRDYLLRLTGPFSGGLC